MPFWETLGNSFASGAGQALGGSVLQNALGLGEDGFNKSDLAFAHNKDIQTAKRLYKFTYQHGRRKGLTPFELLGNGMSQANTGGAGQSASVLGNAATAEMQQERMFAREAAQAGFDRQTALQQTKMQTDAQVKTAQIKAGTDIRGQDIQKAIADNRLKLDRDTYNYVTIPTLKANLDLNAQQVKKLMNEVVTSEKDFVVYMKQLSMGVDNMIVEYYQRHHNINLKDPESFTNLPFEKREQLLGGMLALGSSVSSTWEGLNYLLDEILPKRFPNLFERIDQMDLRINPEQGNLGNYGSQKGYRGRFNLPNTIGVEG